MSQIITASYQNSITVDFTTEAWFNATSVAKQFKKRTENYLRTDSTKEYMVELHNELFPENPITLKSVDEENQLVRVKTGSPENGGGSWLHPELAVDFARWLSPRFAIWCDRQIKKILKGEPVQRDFVNEPLKIPFATKEQREPLVRAVRRLVSVASEKGKSISYENAHSIINLKMGVSSVEELTLEQIPQAMALVGDILERVVLEGEFIAKGEPEPQAKVEPEIPSDPFTNREREQLQKIVSSLSGKFHFNNVWTSAIHYRLRKATGCKSPNYFRISDKPVMAKEFGQIFTIVSKVQSVIRKVELESAKRLMRNDEEFETVIAELETDCKTLLSELEGEVKTLLDTCDRYEIERFVA